MLSVLGDHVPDLLSLFRQRASAGYEGSNIPCAGICLRVHTTSCVERMAFVISLLFHVVQMAGLFPGRHHPDDALLTAAMESLAAERRRARSQSSGGVYIILQIFSEYL